MDAPKYQQPELSPAYAQLMADSKQEDIDAIQARVRGDTASLTSRYGTLTSGDNAGILARYGAQLAMANAGTSPMLRSAA